MLMKERLIADGIFDKVKQSFINENVNRFAYNLKTMETSDSYEKVLDKLREIYAQELGLGDYPRNYYYKQDNYEYLCKLLGIDFVSKQNENNKLATLRDALLPKLMSGEIDVSAVQL